MPINAHPDYLAAEKKYLECQTDAERILALEDMIRKAPGHKGAENLRAQLKTRLKKLKEKILTRKSKKSGKPGIKKEDRQIALVGYSNVGKSSILTKLTNSNAKISEVAFTTNEPEVGMMSYQGVQIQVIEIPSIDSDNFDYGLANSADIIIFIITNIEQISKIEEKLKKSVGKKIILMNKSDLMTENEKRKITATLKSKYPKYSPVVFSINSKENIEELKEKILENFEIVRIYLKEPGKPVTDKPLVVPPKTTLKGVAEKIKNGLSNRVKEVRITGPSSKFPNQKVGLSHIVKDKDIVEFKTN